MDSVYEVAGAQAASALLEAFWSIGLPLLIALGGVAWRMFRVVEDGVARPLAWTVLGLMGVVWLLRPVEDNGIRVPRYVHLLGRASDAAVESAVRRLDSDFLTRPFEYERVAALAGAARVQDAALREEVARFFGTCLANAAAEGPLSERATRNPLDAGGGLPYGRFVFPDTAEPCEEARGRLLSAIEAEVDRLPAHQAALTRRVPRSTYVDRLVWNERHGVAAGGLEMILVQQSVGHYDLAHTRSAGAQAPSWRQASMDLASFLSPPVLLIRKALGDDTVNQAVDGAVAEAAKIDQGVSDEYSSKQRYYLVTAHAPYFYGLTLMLLSALFPVAGLWALYPGKWTALVNYAKVFVSVKLWPIGWALLSRFTAKRPIEDALWPGEEGSPFLAATLLYFAIPGLSFLVVNAASSAASAAFQAPSPSGPGPVAGAARQVVARAR